MRTPPGARVVSDPAELQDHFADMPAAHIYALGDLEEPFWSNSTWYWRDGAVVGVVGMPEGTWQAVYAVSTRNPCASLDLVADMIDDLPAGQFVTASEGLESAIAGRRKTVWSKPHVRYELVDPSAVPAPDVRVVALGPGHLDMLHDLYSEPDSAFLLPHMIGDDTFVGVFDSDRLVAAAGTHIVSDQKRMAAIGAVYVTPTHRGSGLGRALMAGVIDRLGGRVDLIGLNVAADNTAARALYESIGFEPILTYDEAELA
ncbi:MAG: GNAT family N-acetyltransferase [Actinomycetia bacterium]|nr:GNAT family N-acetyltransferase [Actinomycetes bacterium]MCP4957712.1 GNAT family N-acetyltransferase [Actinomycetes bacterium]